MVSEFGIRQELKEIELLPAPPLRRARRIVRLARTARREAIQMAILGRNLAETGDAPGAFRFVQAARQFAALHEELRACAQTWLPTR